MQNDNRGDFTSSSGLGGAGLGSGAGTGTGGTSGAGYASTGGLGATTGGLGGQTHADSTLDQAKQAVSDAAQRTTERVQSRLDAQKEHAADSLSSIAQTLRSSVQQLEGQPAGIGGYVQRAADQVDDFAYYLRGRDVGEIVDEVEDFARRQPGIFLGAAFSLGLLGARFLKSSRRNLVREGVREGWSAHEMTGRIDNAEFDAVGRPGAPGYVPPSERGSTDPRGAGPRDTQFGLGSD
ncbi:MAG: hypothetical protein M3418_03000 [Gemmatimonadota bacterium]|nr:hypothetical protein [Gemmatimonadota bacterium]